MNGGFSSSLSVTVETKDVLIPLESKDEFPLPNNGCSHRHVFQKSELCFDTIYAE